MKLTLIQPCIGRRVNQPYIRSWQMEPLTIATLAGLTPSGVELRFYDDRMEAIAFDEPTDAVAIPVETYTARRAYQIAYNTEHGIVPTNARKQGDYGSSFAEQLAARKAGEQGEEYGGTVYGPTEIPLLTQQMIAAAEELRFEEAARLRDLIHRIESEGSASAAPEPGKRKPGRKRRRSR